MPSFDLERSETIISSSGTSPLRAVAIAVAVGAAFGAGALTGKTGSAARPTEGSVLAAADRRADELEQRRSGLKLTFASDLARADPAVKPIALPGTSGAAKVASVSEQAPTPIGAPPEREPEKAPEPPKAPADPTDDDDDAQEERARKNADPARMKQALAKVLGSAPASVADGDRAPDANKSAGAPADTKRTYTLQVASTPVKENAEQLAKKLQADGHPARVVAAALEGGKTVYRVRVGSFDAREKADALKAKISMPTFVVGE